MSDPTQPESEQPPTIPVEPPAALMPPTPPAPPAYPVQQQAPTQTPVATYQNPPYGEPTPGIPVTLVKEKTNGLAVTSLVLGIIAFVLAFIPFVNFFAAFVALVGLALGIVAIFQKRASKPIAITGTILSFVAGVLSIILIVAYAAAFVNAVDDTVSKPVASAAAGASAAPSAAPADTNFKFGQTVTYKDGLAITVSTPTPFTPSDSAAGATQAKNIVFTITVKNGTAKNYDPLVYTSLSSGGTEADSIFDVGGDIGNAPTTTILAGQSTTWKEAYSVADPAHLVMDVNPGFGYNKSTFTN
ncbi:DUF4190 domain-containing protein [Diaminobutyricibacter tongyongensis]|uniref:DUF4190 domain-containing protein n=1 Tax=Leifsonia tongyongensis TaxID=1268043 RepID=A0A6L9XUM5_9MICO|nr:DUF4190 domain-containing protein [Diaminobutyricibacter tongyongensis]NEN04718.1 DUF4190 domain-containing protein [Diaminobutyricibacter tongyongensis]